MTNHVHFVVIPEREFSLAKVFGRTHADYARYANLALRSRGHLWQAHFCSCALEAEHTWNALAYVERNPVRGGLRPRNTDGPRRLPTAGRTTWTVCWIAGSGVGDTA